MSCALLKKKNKKGKISGSSTHTTNIGTKAQNSATLTVFKVSDRLGGILVIKGKVAMHMSGPKRGQPLTEIKIEQNSLGHIVACVTRKPHNGRGKTGELREPINKRLVKHKLLMSELKTLDALNNGVGAGVGPGVVPGAEAGAAAVAGAGAGAAAAPSSSTSPSSAHSPSSSSAHSSSYAHSPSNSPSPSPSNSPNSAHSHSPSPSPSSSLSSSSSSVPLDVAVRHYTFDDAELIQNGARSEHQRYMHLRPGYRGPSARVLFIDPGVRMFLTCYSASYGGVVIEIGQNGWLLQQSNERIRLACKCSALRQKFIDCQKILERSNADEIDRAGWKGSEGNLAAVSNFKMVSRKYHAMKDRYERIREKNLRSSLSFRNAAVAFLFSRFDVIY